MADVSDLMRAAVDRVADLASQLDMLQRAIGAGDPHAELALRTQDARASLAALDLTTIDAALAQARREGRGEGMLEERRRWWRPEYPGQVEPTRVAWYRDEPEDGLSGFDTKADRDAFQAGGIGPFIRRVTGNEFNQLPFALPDASPAPEDRWECPECRCHQYALCDEQKEGGSFSPGPVKRCVNCKRLDYSAAPPRR